MDSRRTRLRSQAAVRTAAPAAVVPQAGGGGGGGGEAAPHPPQRRGGVVEVEVESERLRGLPVIVPGVNKRKRDPRGAGRRPPPPPPQHKRDSPAENGTPEDEAKRSESSPGGSISSRASPVAVVAAPAAPPQQPPPPRSTYVIIPEIMPEDQAVMKQLDKRRESSRLRVRPSKFREGFLLSSGIRAKGDQKGAEDGASSLEIVLPMDGHGAASAEPPSPSLQEDNPEPTGTRAPDMEGDSGPERLVQAPTGRNKYKITYNKLGSGREGERQISAVVEDPSTARQIDEQGLKAALAVVKRVMQIKSADPFNEPVDPVALDILDYFDVVKEPMDLGTIREFLETGKKYYTVEEVYRDVQLVWNNCRSYNQEGDPIMDILKIAENVFNKHWSIAGLPLSAAGANATKTQALQLSGMEESSSDDQPAAPNQQGREEAKRRKWRDSNTVGSLNGQKSAQFDIPTSRLKSKRSASVEHLMAESKAREDKLDGVTADLIKDKPNIAHVNNNGELVGEEQLLQKSPVRNSLTKREGKDMEAARQPAVEQDWNAQKGTGGATALVESVVQQEPKTPMQDSKESSVRGASSNKRRTFGTVHHKPDCTCVVCVGRRRKLARQEKEGIVETKGKDDHKKKQPVKSPVPLVRDTAQATSTPQVCQVIEPTKVPEVAETAMASADSPVDATPPVLATGDAADAADAPDTTDPGEPDQSGDCRKATGSEPEPMVDGVRQYPANYEVPLRKLNAPLLQLSHLLFGNGTHQQNVWKRHYSLGCRPLPPMSKSSMFEAVHSLTLSER